MSKSTMEQRAAAYCNAEFEIGRAQIISLDHLSTYVAGHLAAFAAREVARVRNEQMPHLLELTVGARVAESAKVRHNIAVAARYIDNATRPEWPRAKAQEPPKVKVGKLSCGPKCRRDPLTRFEAFTAEAKAAYPVTPKFIEVHGIGCTREWSPEMVAAFNGPLPKGAVVTDVNHKPVKPPMGRILGLSALARNVKKGQR